MRLLYPADVLLLGRRGSSSGSDVVPTAGHYAGSRRNGHQENRRVLSYGWLIESITFQWCMYWCMIINLLSISIPGHQYDVRHESNALISGGRK